MDRNRKLFEILVRENEGALMAYIRVFVRDSALAEDLFQETMLTAWRQFDRFESDRPLAPWLRGIAKNLIRNAWRKQASHRLVFDESTAVAAESWVARIEQQPGDRWQDRVALLSDCVNRLPPHARSLIEASYRDGEQATQLATRFGVSPAAIRKRLQRVRQRLADCLSRRLSEGVG